VVVVTTGKPSGEHGGNGGGDRHPGRWRLLHGAPIVPPWPTLN
jgi:hypothetical protein